jgi:hypothetical protein
MTPEEKAEELISSYRFALSIPNAPLGEHKDSIAKQCALIAVDEILNINSVDKDFSLSHYWLDVKDEIVNLKNKNNV